MVRTGAMLPLMQQDFFGYPGREKGKTEISPLSFSGKICYYNR